MTGAELQRLWETRIAEYRVSGQGRGGTRWLAVNNDIARGRTRQRKLSLTEPAAGYKGFACSITWLYVTL